LLQQALATIFAI